MAMDRKERREEKRELEGHVTQEFCMKVVPSGQTSQFAESALLKPLRHSPPSSGQFVQKKHDSKSVEVEVRPSGKFLDSIMQARKNMSLTFVLSGDICQFDRSWLKLEANQNMLPILVTEEISKLEISWSKLLAPKNISCIVVTEEVLKLEISWLKLAAFWNMHIISVTEEVLKLEISWLKLEAS